MTVPSIADVTAALTAPGQMFEMEEVAIRGIPTRTWKQAPRSLRAVLESSRTFDGRDFLVFEDDHFSFDAHFRAAATLAHRLVNDFRVVKGDRVAIAMRNYPEWSIAFWAAASVGAVLVPLNAWWTGAELEYGLEDSGATVVFVDQERLERLQPHLANLPEVRAVIVARAADRAAALAGALHFGEVVGRVEDEVDLPPAEIDPEDDATIFYTSGTTGRSKGALGTQRNICTNLWSLGFASSRATARSADDPRLAATAGTRTSDQNVYLLSVPFFHATGCHSILVANLAFGGEIVIMHKWEPGRALELIERERVTTFGGVPAMVWQVLEHPDFAKRDISSVKSIGYGGAPAAPELVRRIEAMFPGRTPSNGYGLTETSSVTTLNSGVDYLRKPQSVGVPVAVCDVKVVDPEGQELALGEVGELWIKGPNVVKGYFNKPEATEATFTDGWLHSGDIARIDEEGFVYIVDRAKDMIIRGGENVYCVEVEAALFEHPAVSDAAVIGIPHEVLGEEVGAVVHVTPLQTATEDELRAHVRERLAAFKVPVRIWFYDEPLPRNPAGKILKRELRHQLLGE
ncbi:MAG: class I adenylate-forming enzyme family protein [Acidimicrobiales bacterium]